MRTRPCALVLCLVALIFSSARVGECTNWRAGPLSNDPSDNGTDWSVGATMSWDPDGPGLEPPRLVIGGVFTSLEGEPVNSIAMLNSLTSEWDPLGGGPGFDDIEALTVFEGDLIAAGGNYAVDMGRVARWNGSTWQTLGPDFDHKVRSLCVYDGQLVAGGFFTSVGGDSVQLIAAWNGSTWQPLGGGMPGGGGTYRVLAMTVYNGELIAGGDFYNAGGQPVEHLARWNGSSWQPLATSITPDYPGVSGVQTLALYNGELIVGGYFDGIDGVPLDNIARWDGTTWRSLGSGIEGCDVKCLAYSAGTLIAGGAFERAGGIPVANVARWNGASWQAIGGGVGSFECQLNGDRVIGVADYGGEVIAGGYFSSAGGQPANNIARWNGSQWTSFGGGTATIVRSFAQLGSRLVGGGFFDQSTSTGDRAFNVVSYNGAFLAPLGSGMNDWVIALESYTYPVSGDRELVAGGAFTTADGVSANHVARWVERDVGGPPIWEAMGAGFNDAVYALERFNGAYYAAGAFTSSAGMTMNRIARWNETTDAWEPLGTGLNGSVYALKEYNGSLYAGGVFTTAGGLDSGGLARWNGSAWSRVSTDREQSFFNGSVYALEVRTGSLYIAGQHTQVVSSPNIARWNGTFYSGVVSGANSTVYSLVSSGNNLYAGGDFTTVSGVSAQHFARYDGSWADLGGADGSVRALAMFNGQVHLGGLFSNVDTPAISSPCWAKYHEADIPFIVIPPAPRTVEQGEPVFFTVLPAEGYDPLVFQWYKDGAPLADGPTGTGSEVLGAARNELHLVNVSWFDQGTYSVVISNASGADTSAATLIVIGPTGVPGVESPAGSSAPAISMESVRPNPTRGAMRIAFRLARESDVSLSLYDVSGRLVRHLLVGRLPAGSHETIWDEAAKGNDRISPGVYFLSLDAGGRGRDSRRVVLLR